jgi:hypothetical protein
MSERRRRRRQNSAGESDEDEEKQVLNSDVVSCPLFCFEVFKRLISSSLVRNSNAVSSTILFAFQLLQMF